MHVHSVGSAGCTWNRIFFLISKSPPGEILATFLQIVSTNLKHLTDPGDSVSFAENGDNGGIFSLHINYLIDATVYSPNYIPWRISLLSLTVWRFADHP